MLNPFRFVDLIPNNETRSSFQPEGYDSESEDVDKIIQDDYALKWNTSSDKITSCDCLLIGSSKEGSIFLETYSIQNKSKDFVASASFGSKKQDKLNIAKIVLDDELSKRVSTIYGFNSDSIYAVTFDTDVIPSVRMNLIVRSILRELNPKNVIIFGSLLRHEFKSSELNVDDIQIPSLFQLGTTYGENKLSSISKNSLLAPTNLVSDIGAAFLTQCQLRKINAVLYISLTESIFNVDSVKAFSKVWPVTAERLKIRPTLRFSVHKGLYI